MMSLQNITVVFGFFAWTDHGPHMFLPVKVFPCHLYLSMGIAMGVVHKHPMYDYLSALFALQVEDG